MLIKKMSFTLIRNNKNILTIVSTKGNKIPIVNNEDKGPKVIPVIIFTSRNIEPST